MYRPVLPSVEPGFLQSLLPAEIPEQPEHWKDVLNDIERVIMPGMTHWQSPNFHAYYPTPATYATIIGEMLSASFGVIGFNWVSSVSLIEILRTVRTYYNTSRIHNITVEETNDERCFFTLFDLYFW